MQPANVLAVRRFIGRIVLFTAHSFPAPCSWPVLHHPPFAFSAMRDSKIFVYPQPCWMDLVAVAVVGI